MTAVLTPAEMTAAVPAIGPADVREVLARSILADGLDFVLDIERSTGLVSWSTPAPASATSTCSRSSRRRRWA